MPQIKSSEAFGLSLIRQHPDPASPEVKEILNDLGPAAKEVARRILRSSKQNGSGRALKSVV